MKSIIVLMACAFMVSAFALPMTSTEAEAATTYWVTSHPCADDAWTFAADYYDLYIPGGEPTPVDAPGVKVLWDGDDRNLATSYTTRFVYADTFTDTASWTNYWNASWTVAWFPPANSTIYKVYIVAEFSNGSYMPNLWLEYATDGLTFDNKAWFYGNEDWDPTFIPYYNNTKLWDVTSLQTWDNDTFLSPNFIVRMQAYPIPGFNYYLDYLGLIVYWEGAGGGEWGGVEGDEPVPWDPDFNIIYTEEGFILVLGVIGFIGMISVPPVTILYYRVAEGDRISAFVKALVAFVFCLTLFMVWATAG